MVTLSIGVVGTTAFLGGLMCGMLLAVLILARCARPAIENVEAECRATVFQCAECGQQFEMPGDVGPDQMVEMIRTHFAVEHEKDNED